jgi:hypothetical protein
MAVLWLDTTLCGCGGQSPSGTISDDAGAAATGGVGMERPDLPSPDPCFGPCPDDLSLRPKPLPRPRCPATEPSDESTCSVEGDTCSYGDAHTMNCRRVYDCTNSAWARSKANSPESCADLPPNYCPLTPKPGALCSAEVGIPCEYVGQDCFCVSRFPGPGGMGNWACGGPPANLACPAALPNIGEGCATRGIHCNYGADDCMTPSFTAVLCFQGQWVQADRGGCLL